MSITITLIQFIALIALTYICIAVCYPFILSLIALLKKGSIPKLQNSNTNRIAVMIPAYKEDQVIVGTVQSALNQNYPNEYFEVIVIADSLKASTLQTLETLDCEVHRVQFQNSTKVKALNSALNCYSESNFDIAVVLDADNIMCSDFLHQINSAYNIGCMAIQGQRVSKNKNTDISYMDGLSEDLNNHILCMGQYSIGGSSRLSGSGMAFQWSLLVECLKDMQVINGFDKYLELEIVKRAYRIHYLPHAIILDEKVDNGEVFQKQRTRWLAAQYTCLADNFKEGFHQLFKNRNWDYIQKIVLLALPPKVLFIPFLGLLAIISISLSKYGLAGMFMIFLGLNIITYTIAGASSLFNKETSIHFLGFPKLIMLTFKALKNHSLAKDKFLHTSHNSNQK